MVKDMRSRMNLFVTDMITVFNFYVYALLDLGSSFSFVTLYVANKFEILPKKLCEPFCIYTPVGESNLAERVYLDCPFFIDLKNIVADLVELDMVDSNFILGTD